MYYFYVDKTNDKICGSGLCETSYYNAEVTAQQYSEDTNKYIAVKSGKNYTIEDNPNYEQEEAARERQRLDSMTLTPADVERALYKAKGMDFEDLKAFIAQQLPTIDTKALAIEFRAKDFFRGAEAGGIRLFDVVGQLLGYKIPDDMDYLFANKELPTNGGEE